MKELSLHKNLIMAFLVMLLSNAAQAQELIEKTFSGKEILELQVEGIEVNYQGISGKEDISLEALLGKNENTDKSLIMVSIGNKLKIAYKPPKGNDPTRKFINLKGPESINLNFKNSSGSLRVSNVNAPSTILKVGSGLLDASNINGNVETIATSGKVILKNIQGNVFCDITSGVAEIEKIQGNMDFSATSGMLKAKDILGRLNAKITSGNIRLEEIGELGNLNVTSGNIKAHYAGLGDQTNLQGSSGNIDISTPSMLENYNFDLNAGSGSLRVGNHSHSKTLNIQNGAFPTVKGNIGSGSIRINAL
ncbi:MAG: DUF4097 family beta strand repeat-containing protein [Cyclobacteriaceae bacterium]